MRILQAIALAALAPALAAQPPLPTRAELRRMLVQRTVDLTATRRTLFYHEARLRSELRTSLHDKKSAEIARETLALIGDSGDLAEILRLAPAPSAAPWANRWAYAVATALVDPRTEAEWDFLRRCALNEYNDRWVDAGAIQTLKLIASPRSLRILAEVPARNPDRARSAADAIRYIQSNPASLESQDLAALAARVAAIVRIGKWEGNEKARYNLAGDKALIDITFSLPEDRLIYTATFHRTGGLWRLRGVRETLQMFMVRIAEPTADFPPPPVTTMPPIPELKLPPLATPKPAYNK